MEAQEREAGLAELDGQFMRPETSGKTEWWEVDGTGGTLWFPCDYFTEDEAKEGYDGDAWEIFRMLGFGARLSAPGYLDCTEWTVFETEREAEEFLVETYCE